MGLDVNGIRSLLYAKKIGVDFSRTAMIGRQAYIIAPSDLAIAFESFGYHMSAHDAQNLLAKNGYYIESMLSYLGAELIHSFDCTAYEGATHIHDMNDPLPDSMSGQYDLVVDSGTLEHVFNYPVAIKNCMELLATGGTCLLITPANNLCGHGFYQFSPELFFNIFSSVNGFQILDIIVFEDRPYAPWFSVCSPMAVGQRVMLQSGRPAYLLVIAKKVADVEIFSSAPQQSDYVTAWDRWRINEQSPQPMSCQQQDDSQHQLTSGSRRAQPFSSVLKRLVPTGIKSASREAVRGINAYVLNPFNPAFFTPIDPTADR